MNFLASNLNGADFLLSLLLILVVAKLFAEVFERLGQPAVVGEILAGIIIGPSVLALVKPTDIISTFAEIGVIFCSLQLGLKQNHRQF